MFIIISPAKKLHEQAEVRDPLHVPVKLSSKNTQTTSISTLEASKPYFFKEARQLVKELLPLEIADLMKLMGISRQLAELNYQRYRQLFNTKEYCAVYLFQGDTYQGLQAATLGRDELITAQQNLRIISGLYGLLRPLDLINPYRLEMGSYLANQQGKNLYDFWGDKLAQLLITQMQQANTDILINLASDEYAKAVIEYQDLFSKNDIKIITPKFYDRSKADGERTNDDAADAKYKVIGFFAKKARGFMARYIIQNQVKQHTDLSGFNLEGYQFAPNLSTASQPIFRRNLNKAA